jgi:type II secretory pathway component PulC
MSPWKYSFNTLTLLLFTALVMACATLYLQWSRPPQIQLSIMPQELVLSADFHKRSKISHFIAPPVAVFREITERPLFTEGRLPPQPHEQTINSPVIPIRPLKLRLEGIVITPNNRVAVIRDVPTNCLLRVAQGMNQDDWKLEVVNSSSVSVVRRGKKYHLELQIDKNNKMKPANLKLPFRPSSR